MVAVEVEGEDGVGGLGADGVDPQGPGVLDGGADVLDLLGAEHAPLPDVRVEGGDADGGALEAEPGELGVDVPEVVQDPFAVGQVAGPAQ